MRTNTSLTSLKFVMKKAIPLTNGENFGSRLAQIRRSKGFTQQELGNRIGVSQRVIAYYEKETKHLPANYLPLIAKTLKVTIDELMGFKLYKEDIKPKNPKLWRRLRQIEQLPLKEQKILIHYLDTLLKSHQA